MKIENVCKSYKGIKVLDNAGLEFTGGQCIGILGSNGSGKSTLLSVLSGVIRAQGGSFIADGVDLLLDEKKRSEMLAFVPQDNVLYDELSVRDNLKLWYDKRSMESSLENGVLKQLGVGGFLDKRVSHLSGGMKKRVSIACCVANSPKILLLDEPTAALDIEAKAFIGQYIKDFVNNGGTVILTSHDISDMAWMNEIFILKRGRLISYDGTPDLDSLLAAMNG